MERFNLTSRRGTLSSSSKSPLAALPLASFLLLGADQRRLSRACLIVLFCSRYFFQFLRMSSCCSILLFVDLSAAWVFVAALLISWKTSTGLRKEPDEIVSTKPAWMRRPRPTSNSLSEAMRPFLVPFAPCPFVNGFLVSKAWLRSWIFAWPSCSSV